MSKLQEQAEKWRVTCIELKYRNDKLEEENKRLKSELNRLNERLLRERKPR